MTPEQIKALFDGLGNLAFVIALGLVFWRLLGPGEPRHSHLADITRQAVEQCGTTVTETKVYVTEDDRDYYGKPFRCDRADCDGHIVRPGKEDCHAENCEYHKRYGKE